MEALAGFPQKIRAEENQQHKYAAMNPGDQPTRPLTSPEPSSPVAEAPLSTSVLR